MKKLARSGTTSKIIHYSMPKNDKRFIFQDPQSMQNYNPAIELKGHLNINNSKQVNENQNLEYNPFRKMNIKQLPDSKRTLVPQLNYEPSKIVRSKSSLHLNKTEDSNNFKIAISQQNYTENEQLKEKSKQRLNNKTYISNVLTNQNECSPYVKPTIKFNEYSKYNRTTQITYLPGGAKRNDTDISDDQTQIRNKIQRTSGKTLQKKIDVDYKSNISCLPNTGVMF